jgi:DNA-binding transcriptional MocR family regulator
LSEIVPIQSFEKGGYLHCLWLFLYSIALDKVRKKNIVMVSIQQIPDSTQKPRYRAIADALADQIASGELEPGERLPTHRDLAYKLGVTVGTVSRAYGELERAGLARGEVGRGTFVRGGDPDDFMQVAHEPPGGGLDLGNSFPPPGRQALELSDALRALADDRSLGHFVSYQPHAGRPEHRTAGAEWLGRGNYDVTPDQVIVTSGAQHGLLASLSTVLRPGDKLGVEALCFPGMKVVARMLGCHLEPLAMDEEGITAEAVEAACRNGVRVFCCVPTLSNPTCAVMSVERRQAVADILKAHGAFLVEDDIYGLLPRKPLVPIASFAPENTLYVTSLSKAVSPGLRIGYLVVPSSLHDKTCTAVRASCWMAAPLMAEIATRWICDGSAARILEAQRREVAKRMQLATEILGPLGASRKDGAFHLWFKLPEPWTTASFVEAARREDVILSSEAPFVVPGTTAPRALRICLGTPARRPDLEAGLRKLAEILSANADADEQLSIV